MLKFTDQELLEANGKVVELVSDLEWDLKSDICYDGAPEEDIIMVDNLISSGKAYLDDDIIVLRKGTRAVLVVESYTSKNTGKKCLALNLDFGGGMVVDMDMLWEYMDVVIVD